MAWDLQNEEWLTAIASTTAPPAGLEAIQADEFWSQAFSLWATDLGFTQGAYGATNLLRMSAELAYGTPGSDIYINYIHPSAETGIQWPESLLEGFAAVGADEDYSGVIEEAKGVVAGMLEQHVAQFRADVHALQSANVSEPRMVAIEKAVPDADTMDRINQAALKGLSAPDWDAEDESPYANSRATFYVRGAVVLIGDDHPTSSYEYMYAARYTWGYLIMEKKGKGFSAGRIRGVVKGDVAGGEDVPDYKIYNQDDAREKVTEAVSRISKKELVWPGM